MSSETYNTRLAMMSKPDSLESRVDAAMLSDSAALRKRLRGIRKRAKAGKPTDRSLAELLGQLERSEARVRERQGRVPAVRYPEDLPIAARREEIRAALEAHQVVVVCGETGSGKTTQLPKICLEMGRGVRGRIGHTQPRRIAARSLARRISEELSVPLGGDFGVGYKMRFTDGTRESTFIKVMTDGILLAETQGDRELREYDTLIIDEAHERSLNIDFLLGYIRQLLPRRPDLKVIVTSATIDPDRFSRHFNDAPVIEVSGRTYPVEVRYRPVQEDDDRDEERTEADAIVDAVDELGTEAPGDVLVFLPGEREIRETAEALRKHHVRTRASQVEVLPLYARLSADDQARIFKPHAGQRIILATNVAETSLTVPGIRYVVDTGLARISRYQARTRVQGLPIEKVSQASANQRAGRCGRVSAGICIRLYARDDFESRPMYTDPEILRTNLASVILRMKALGLGDLDRFPFIEPPDPRMIRDGYETLREIGAVDMEDQLTERGRTLARIPVDPRIGRILLAGAEEDCLREILIIASAMSVQDPRDRPHEKRDAADEAHARFADPTSDFMSWLNLWEFYHVQAKKLSRRKLFHACRDNFISFVRMREWHDTHRQLRTIVRDLGYSLRSEQNDPDPDAIHRALLAGLLTQVGQKQEKHEYAGPNGVRFSIFPGSVLFRGAPRWVMASELVRTTRLYARSVGPVQPQWIERQGAHLVKRTYSEPSWDAARQQVTAVERVTLFGMPLIQGRTVHYGPIDPEAARHIFIHHALVEGELSSRAPFLAHNARLTEDVRRLESKQRKADILVETELRHAFYEQRIPAGIYDRSRFDKWYRNELRKSPRVLFMSLDDLMEHEASDVTHERFPDTLAVDGVQLPLEYRNEPGTEDDGVTVTVPLEALNRVSGEDLAALVPGMLEDKIVALIRSLPKHIRTNLVPAPDYARRAAEDVDSGSGSFLERLAGCLGRYAGMEIPVTAFDPASLPRHLRMNVRIVDDKGRHVAEGRDVNALRQELREQVREHFAAVSRDAHRRTGMRKWDFDELPDSIEIEEGGAAIKAYPAIVDRGAHVDLEMLDSRGAATRATRVGLRRLCMIECAAELQHRARHLPGFDRMATRFAPMGSRELLREQVVEAIADRAFIADLPRVRTASEFEARLDLGWNRLTDATDAVASLIDRILDARHQVELRLSRDTVPAWAGAERDVRNQLTLLMPAMFIRLTPWGWLQHMPRYLNGILRRFDRLKHSGPQRDAELLHEVMPFWRDYIGLLQSPPSERPDLLEDPEFEMYRWMIEELRVSLFAQDLGTAVKVSPQRLAKQREKLLVRRPVGP